MTRTWLDELSIPRPPYRRPMMARVVLAAAPQSELPATREDWERMQDELEAKAAAEAAAEKPQEKPAERPAELTAEQASKDMELGLAGMIESMEAAEREKPLAPEAMADAKAAMTAEVEASKAEVQGPPTRLEADLKAQGKGPDTIAGMRAQAGAGPKEAEAIAKQPATPETPTGKVRRLSREALDAKNRWMDAEEKGAPDAAQLKQEYAAKRAELDEARPAKPFDPTKRITMPVSPEVVAAREAAEKVTAERREDEDQERATGEGMPEKAAEDPRDARIRELERKVNELTAKAPEAAPETDPRLAELEREDPVVAKNITEIAAASKEGQSRFAALKETQARVAEAEKSEMNLFGFNEKAASYDAKGMWNGFFTWWHSVWEKKAKDGLKLMQERLAKQEEAAQKYREKSWLHTAAAPVWYGIGLWRMRGEVEELKATIKRHEGNRKRHQDARKDLQELAAGQLEVHVRAAEGVIEKGQKDIDGVEKRMAKATEIYQKLLNRLAQVVGKGAAEQKVRQQIESVLKKMEGYALEKAGLSGVQRDARESATKAESEQGAYLAKVGLTRESSRTTGRRTNTKAA